jgi:hypothetical protein
MSEFIIIAGAVDEPSVTSKHRLITQATVIAMRLKGELKGVVYRVVS